MCADDDVPANTDYQAGWWCTQTQAERVLKILVSCASCFLNLTVSSPVRPPAPSRSHRSRHAVGLTTPPPPSDKQRPKTKKRLYAGFPRRFEKHCVVIGPLDPNCFEGGYPSPRSPPEGLNGVLRDLTSLKNKRPLNAAAAAAAAVGGRMGGAVAGAGGRASGEKTHVEEEEFGPRPFVPLPRPFAMDSPAYQARAWDMWEPGGGGGGGGSGAGAGLRGGLGNGMGNRVGKEAGNSYVVLFDYGSVIFIHFSQQQRR